jgi:hypothetical protein
LIQGYDISEPMSIDKSDNIVKDSVAEFKNGNKIKRASSSKAVRSPKPTIDPVQEAYFQNLPKQTAPGYVRNKDRNVKCFCGSGLKVKYCCSWKTVANFVISNGSTWYKKINEPGHRQIDLAGMPVPH